MLNKTLDQLIEETRAESRLSTDNSRGLENRENIKQIVARNYEVLFGDYDWPHLAVKREDCFVTMEAGARYYDYPDMLDVETIKGAAYRMGNVWVPLEYGIQLATYNMLDSEADRRADPVLRWMIRDDRQFEVWPIPASNGNLVGFEGKRKFVPLNKGSDRCLIDSIVVVLFSAAEILASVGAKDAQIKAQQASARLVKMRARTAAKSRCVIGGQDPNFGRNSGNAQGWPRLRVVYAR